MPAIFAEKSKAIGLQREGYTLLEITIVLGIVGLITAGIWVASSQVRLAQQIRTADGDLAQIVQNIRTIYAEQGVDGTAPVLTLALDQMQAFPTDMRPIASTPTGVLLHPWSSNGGINYQVFVYASFCIATVGGAGVIPSASGTGNPAPCFVVDFRGVPPTQCVQLVMDTSRPTDGLEAVGVSAPAVAGTGGAPVVAEFFNETIGGVSIDVLPTLQKVEAACIAPVADVMWLYSVRQTY